MARSILNYMLPRFQPYRLSSTGDTNAGLFEDINTRNLQTVRIGESAGKINKGIQNIFVGYESGKQSVNANYITAIGY